MDIQNGDTQIVCPRLKSDITKGKLLPLAKAYEYTGNREALPAHLKARYFSIHCLR